MIPLLYSGNLLLSDCVIGFYLLGWMISDDNYFFVKDSVDIFNLSWSSGNLTTAGIAATVKEHWQLNWKLCLSSRVCCFILRCLLSSLMLLHLHIFVLRVQTISFLTLYNVCWYDILGSESCKSMNHVLCLHFDVRVVSVLAGWS